MSLRQTIIRKIFRWSQALLEPPSPNSIRYQTIGVYDHIPVIELANACDLLTKYQTIELSYITHHVGEINEYTCILLVGGQREETE